MNLVLCVMSLVRLDKCNEFFRFVLADFLFSFVLIVVGEGMTFYTYSATTAVFKYCAIWFLLLF